MAILGRGIFVDVSHFSYFSYQGENGADIVPEDQEKEVSMRSISISSEMENIEIPTTGLGHMFFA